MGGIELYGISIDVGTSGTRMHAVDLKSGQILSTAMTVRHPVPGANVMDHLTFCIDVNQNLAHRLMIDTVNRLIDLLDVDKNKVERLAICGNPIQLSLFQNMELRDLAFAGERALKVRGVEHQKRDAKVLNSEDLGIKLGHNAQLYVPPSIKHEIGADALAMMYKTGFLESKEICMVTDYGTNAEMALKVGDEIYTGSAAAGPAMEGQSVHFGMLASPGSICDVNLESYWRCKVLNDNLLAKEGDLVEINTGNVVEEGEMHGKARGITGTGVVAAIALGIENNNIKPPNFTTLDGMIHLQDGVSLDQKDYLEASKAFGAMRAGHFTLMEHAGIKFDDLDTFYMSGASGTYVDALKAQKVGLLPATPKNIYQVGNTSLAMATDIVKDPQMIDVLQTKANSIRANHVMFAMDKVFETLYLQELGMWQEGMPVETYNFFLKTMDIQELPSKIREANVYRIVERDIPVLGKKGLKILRDIGITINGTFDGCIGCHKCEEDCPEDAISIVEERDEYLIRVRSDLCNGTACLRCERICPEKVFIFKSLNVEG